MKDPGADRAHISEKQLLDHLQAYLEKQGEQLGCGWKVLSRRRQTGESAGTWDHYYYSQDGTRLRSRREVLEYVRKTQPHSKQPRERIANNKACKATSQPGQRKKKDADLIREDLAQDFPLLQLSDDILYRTLSLVNMTDLLRISSACTGLARISEPLFREWHERQHKHNRSASSIKKGRAKKWYHWRSLFWKEACRTCGEAGEVSVRRSSSQNCALPTSPHSFWICKRHLAQVLEERQGLTVVEGQQVQYTYIYIMNRAIQDCSPSI